MSLPRLRFMSRATMLMLVALSTTSCSTSVSRTGYEPRSVGESTCRVAVKRAAPISPDQADVLGEVDVGDTGFSTDCDEKTVVELLRKEACSAGAHVVDIVEERRQDVASSCYRAKARLLRLRNPSSLPVDDARFAASSVQARSDLDNQRTNSLLWGAVITGAVAGIVTGVVFALGR